MHFWIDLAVSFTISVFLLVINDYLLLTGDPAIIGVACSIVSDMTNGKYNLLKWDKQDRMYYPIKEFSLFYYLIQQYF